MAQPVVPSASLIVPAKLGRAVARMTGRPVNADLERQITVVVTLLGARLDAADRRAVATRVDPNLRAALDRPLHIDGSEAAFEVALSGRVEANVARATCTVLAEMLDEQGRCHLRLQPLAPWLLRRTS